ncbi:MAG: zinc metallopeptidase [Eubacterium sp.]|nr:zinc metallopeptidase [Eubacterium sp.]
MYYGGYGFYWDWTYILVIVGAVICLAASARVRSSFNKYSSYRSNSGMTGAQAAQLILQRAGITDVSVIHVSGSLTDHYDSRKKVVALSDGVFQSASVAAVGIAAHECGHAMQHANGYVPLRLRSSMVPVVNFGSSLSWPLIIIGLLMNRYSVGFLILEIGIVLFTLVVIFQLVTLPVEFNASHRAVNFLEDTQILDSNELVYTKKVLSAAAMTYVAGAAASILQLLRILLIAGGRRN